MLTNLKGSHKQHPRNTSMKKMMVQHRTQWMGRNLTTSEGSPLTG